jgi:preprotein translocase subunit Sss1
LHATLSRGRESWNMLSPELGHFAFRWAIFIVLVAAGLLVTLSPGTPEFAVTVLTLLIGLLFLGVIAFCVRVVGR